MRSDIVVVAIERVRREIMGVWKKNRKEMMRLKACNEMREVKGKWRVLIFCTRRKLKVL